jgi:hypothetical protein
VCRERVLTPRDNDLTPVLGPVVTSPHLEYTRGQRHPPMIFGRRLDLGYQAVRASEAPVALGVRSCSVLLTGRNNHWNRNER